MIIRISTSVLALILYLLVGLAITECMKREHTICSWIEYLIMVTLYPIIITITLCMILRDWWRDKR